MFTWLFRFSQRVNIAFFGEFSYDLNWYLHNVASSSLPVAVRAITAMDIQLLSLIFFQSILKERSWRVLASASTFYFSLRYDILQCIFKIFELFVILSYGLLYSSFYRKYAFLEKQRFSLTAAFQLRVWWPDSLAALFRDITILLCNCLNTSMCCGTYVCHIWSAPRVGVFLRVASCLPFASSVSVALWLFSIHFCLMFGTSSRVKICGGFVGLMMAATGLWS